MNELRFASCPVAWIVLLHSISLWMRRSGATCVGQAMEQERTASALFSSLPQTSSTLVQEFARTLMLYFCTGALDSDDIDAYYSAFQQQRRPTVPEDLLTLRLIQVFFRASLHTGPYFAAEFARQTLPAAQRPSQLELMEILRQYKIPLRQFLEEKF